MNGIVPCRMAHQRNFLGRWIYAVLSKQLVELDGGAGHGIRVSRDDGGVIVPPARSFLPVLLSARAAAA